MSTATNTENKSKTHNAYETIILAELFRIFMNCKLVLGNSYWMCCDIRTVVRIRR